MTETELYDKAAEFVNSLGVAISGYTIYGNRVEVYGLDGKLIAEQVIEQE